MMMIGVATAGAMRSGVVGIERRWLTVGGHCGSGRRSVQGEFSADRGSIVEMKKSPKMQLIRFPLHSEILSAHFAASSPIYQSVVPAHLRATYHDVVPHYTTEPIALHHSALIVDVLSASGARIVASATDGTGTTLFTVYSDGRIRQWRSEGNQEWFE